MSEGLPIEVTCRVVGVSVTGLYMWRRRKPSARAVRHAMVAEVIRQGTTSRARPTAPDACIPRWTSSCVPVVRDERSPLKVAWPQPTVADGGLDVL